MGSKMNDICSCSSLIVRIYLINITSGEKICNIVPREYLVMSIDFIKILTHSASRVAQSVYCLATGWTTGRSGLEPRQRRKDFSSSLWVQTRFGAQPASYTMGTGGP
jgi:hypothetical protein